MPLLLKACGINVRAFDSKTEQEDYLIPLKVSSKLLKFELLLNAIITMRTCA